MGMRASRQTSELLLLVLLLFFYFSVSVVDQPSVSGIANLVGPIAYGAILTKTTLYLHKSDPLLTGTPLFWFRLACISYFAVGALVPFLVNLATLDAIYGLYSFSAQTNLKLNTILTMGTLMTLFSANIFLRFRFTRSREPGKRLKSKNPLSLALMFLLVGGALRYFVVVPFFLGISEMEVAGSLIALSKLYYVGIFLLTIYTIDHNRVALFPTIFLISLEVVVSIATFSKSELLQILIFASLPFVLRKQRLIVYVSIITTLVLTYSLFQPLVQYGRNILISKYGQIQGGTLKERIDIVSDYLFLSSNALTDDGVQLGLLRLSYANASSFVVDQYDNGRLGDSLNDALIVVIPRVLWPSKPVLSTAGNELNELIFGDSATSLGVGYFAEAYWNGGWLMLIIVCTTLGAILSVLSRFSYWVLYYQKWIFFPAVLLGIRIAFRVDGWFLIDVIGPTWMIAIAISFLWFFDKIISGFTRNLSV